MSSDNKEINQNDHCNAWMSLMTMMMIIVDEDDDDGDDFDEGGDKMRVKLTAACTDWNLL